MPDFFKERFPVLLINGGSRIILDGNTGSAQKNVRTQNTYYFLYLFKQVHPQAAQQVGGTFQEADVISSFIPESVKCTVDLIRIDVLLAYGGFVLHIVFRQKVFQHF